MSLKQIFGTKQQLKEGFIPTKNEIDIAPELAFLAIAYYSIQSVKYALENMCPHLFEKEEIGNCQFMKIFILSSVKWIT